jgi:phosphate transport system protein
MHPHISEEFEAELEQASALLMEMGGLVEQQLSKACAAFVNHDGELAGQVRAADRKVNQFEVDLDDLCVNIIARRQPAATDLRTLISVMKASTDLERIGDESRRIAKMAQAISHLEFPSDQYADFRDLSARVARILSDSLDAFARLDPVSAVKVIASDQAIDDAYDDIVKSRGTRMRERSEDIDRSLNVLWSARALERVGDHSKNIGEYVVYLVKGKDVRHTDATAAISGD